MNGMFACIGDCFPDGGQAAFSQPITGWRLHGQSTINMFSYSRYGHLETLIMAAASCGPGLTAARRRAYMECDLKAMVRRFGMQAVRDALSRYSDKYTTEGTGGNEMVADRKEKYRNQVCCQVFCIME